MFPVNLVFYFHITVLSLLFFRTASIDQILGLANQLLFNFQLMTVDIEAVKRLIFFSWFLVLIQFIQYRKDDLMFILKEPAPLRAIFYLICF